MMHDSLSQLLVLRDWKQKLCLHLKKLRRRLERYPQRNLCQEDTEMAEEQQTPKVVAPTQDQINAIKAAIVNSQTLEEVARLEQALKSGQLPADLKILDEDTPMNTVKDKDDEMAVTNENEANVEVKDVEEQKNNEAESMDQE